MISKKLNNVAPVIKDKPVLCQKKKLGRHRGSTLFAFYEEMLQTKHRSDYSKVLPNKITIFQNAIEKISASKEEFGTPYGTQFGMKLRTTLEWTKHNIHDAKKKKKLAKPIST